MFKSIMFPDLSKFSGLNSTHVHILLVVDQLKAVWGKKEFFNVVERITLSETSEPLSMSDLHALHQLVDIHIATWPHLKSTRMARVW